MRLTFRNARIDKQGKHNDRNFNLELASHIDQNKLDQNKYWTYNGNNIDTFSQIEKEFYETNFSDYLNAQNERKISNGNRNRTKTMDEYRTGRYQPEDKILQIGDIKEHLSGEKLWECALEYAEKFDERYGEHCKIIDMALHMDEATPHVHIRRVWMSQDENGLKCVNQSKALEDMGIRELDTTKPITRTNNAKITFTYDDRFLMEEICKEKGIELHKPVSRTLHHYPTQEFKSKKLMEAIESIEERTQVRYSSIPEIEDVFKKESESLNEAIQVFENCPLITEDEKEEAKKKKNIAASLTYYMELLNKNLEYINTEKSYDENIKELMKHTEDRIKDAFIEKKGLKDEYLMYRDTQLDKIREQKPEVGL